MQITPTYSREPSSASDAPSVLSRPFLSWLGNLMRDYDDALDPFEFDDDLEAA